MTPLNTPAMAILFRTVFLVAMMEISLGALVFTAGMLGSSLLRGSANRSDKILQFSPTHAKVLVCLLGALFAVIDLLAPANINVAVFYFVIIVLLGWTRSIQWLWTSTVVFILLTFAGITLAPPPIANAITWVDWLNRGMIAAALAVAAIAVHYRLQIIVALERSIAEEERAQRELQRTRDQLEDRVKERTSALAATIEELQKENVCRIQAERQLRESEYSLRELSVELLHAQDEERRHIGQELHDGLGQCIVGLKLNLHLLKGALPPGDKEAGKCFSECTHLAEEALQQVRTLSHLLYPPILQEMGLESAIPWYVRGFQQRSGIQTALEMPQSFPRLPQELELTLFRILQESLTNIHSHSGSRTAQVRFQFANGKIVLQIKDSGAGLRNQATGVGLRSMQERVKQLKGTLDISSGPQGTMVTATLPYREQSTSVGAP